MRDPIGGCRVLGLLRRAAGWGMNEGVLKKLGKPMPKTWDDLTLPDYKGLIAVANPNTSGTAFTMLAAILQLKGGEKGWEYLAKLHKNVAQYSKSGSAPGQLAGQGEVAIAVIFLHDVVMFAEEGFPLKAVAPADGTGYEIGGLSLIKGAPHTRRTPRSSSTGPSRPARRRSPRTSAPSSCSPTRAHRCRRW